MRPAALVPLAGLVLVAACGSGSSSHAAKTTLTSDFAADLRASVARSTGQSSKVGITIATSTPQGGQSIAGTGVFSGGSNPVADISLTTPSLKGTIEERVVGGTLYLHIPQLGSWLSLKYADLVGTSYGTSASPTDSAKILLATGKDVTKVGTETVRGTRTTHYKGTIPVDASNPKLGGFAKQAVEQLAKTGVTSLPFDAYLDDQGRLRKLVESTDVTVKGVTAHVVTTLEQYDYGTKVSVTAPPASQVKDGSGFLSALKNQLGKS